MVRMWRNWDFCTLCARTHNKRRSKSKSWRKVLVTSSEVLNAATPEDSPVPWTLPLCSQCISFLALWVGFLETENISLQRGPWAILEWMEVNEEGHPGRWGKWTRVCWWGWGCSVHGAVWKQTGAVCKTPCKRTRVFIGQILWDCWGVVCKGRTKVEREEF